MARQWTTFSARRHRRAARHVALRALCVALRVALCAQCVVDVVLCAPCVVPDAVPYQTSAFQWTAWRAWWAASGLQPVSPSELQARPQVQTQPRIQKEQERFDDRPASVPNVRPCQAPGLLPSCTSYKFQRVGIDLRWQRPSRRNVLDDVGVRRLSASFSQLAERHAHYVIAQRMKLTA